jgi:hypothetical protein
MRKFLGLFVAAGLLVSAAAVVSAPAGAAGGTSCKTGKGTATFTPPLPPIGKTAKVKDVLKSKGTVAGCSGAVKSATITGVSPKSTGSNCTTLGTSKTATKVTLTVKWNKGAASTVAGQLKVITGKPATNQAFTGKISAGQFKGLSVSGKILYKIPTGQCTAKPLSNVTYADQGAFTIK